MANEKKTPGKATSVAKTRTTKSTKTAAKSSTKKAAAKSPQKAKTTRKPRAVTAKTKKAVPSSQSPTRISSEERIAMIQTAAYYLAEKRDYQGDYQLDDWVTAEKEIDARIN